MSTSPTKFVPRATPETQPYWDGTAAGELRIQQCVPEQHTYFYPRTSCPVCGTEEVKWVTAAEQRAALEMILSTIRPSELALPKALLDRIPPRPSGKALGGGLHGQILVAMHLVRRPARLVDGL